LLDLRGDVFHAELSCCPARPGRIDRKLKPGIIALAQALATPSNELTAALIHLIVNPKSGSGSRAADLVEFRAAMRSAGREIAEHHTTGPGDATEYARRIADQADMAVVWGGDGTVREVAAGLAGTGVAVLPCQAGTENLLAKELGIPSHPHALANVIAAGRTVDCDLGLVNDGLFMLIMGIGFDGEVVRRLASIRRGHITHLSYFWPIWRTFWEHDFPRLRVEVDGREIFNDYGLAFVGNISRYAVGLRICSEALFNDGLLDLVIFSCHEQTALLLHAAWTLLRMHPLKGNVIYRQFHEARIETDRPVPSQMDGDIGPNTPLDIHVHPERLRLVIPPPRHNAGLWPWHGEPPL
jgi:YegS/Rv2252/BmrU family lipid kinase